MILTSLVLSACGLIGVTYGVIQAGQDGWSSTSALVPLVVGVIALVGFAAWERRRPRHHGESFIDVELFRSARFTWGTVLATMVSFALFGLLFAMPQYFQGVTGLGRSAAAFACSPSSVALSSAPRLPPDSKMRRHGIRAIRVQRRVSA